MKDHRFRDTPLAEDFALGDDSDLPGFNQPFTRDDVDAVLNSPNASAQERRDLLGRMLQDLEARQGMDEAREYSGLIGDIRNALAALAGPSDGVGLPGAYAFDPDDRALAPDEILERAEEEKGREDD